MMTKLFIVLILALFSVNVVYADVMNRDTVEEVIKKKLSLEKSYFDDILSIRIEFSQEDYQVGDIIDIVIHFEINKEKNGANYQFAIQDYKNKFLSSNCKKHRDQITKRDIVRRNKVVLRDTLCKFIECDSDLILNNEQSEGTYHIKFKLTGKSFGTPFFNKKYPYIFVSLSMNEFIYSEDHKYISDYFGTIDYPGGFRHLNIPIKLNNESFKKKSISTKPEIKGLPKALPERKNPKRSELDSSIEPRTLSRETDIVLSGEVTYCGIGFDPYEIDDYDNNLGFLTISEYEGYPCFQLNAFNHTNYTGWINFYVEGNPQLYTIDINVINSYDFSGKIKMLKEEDEDEFVNGRGRMQRLNSDGVLIESYPLTILGAYSFTGFLPGDNIRYAAISGEMGLEEAFVLEYSQILGEVIVSNYWFQLDPQIVYFILNFDDSELNMNFFEDDSYFNYDDHTYYIDDEQIVVDNKMLIAQRRAETFSQLCLQNNTNIIRRESFFIYADASVNHPYFSTSGFLPESELPDYDKDIVHITNQHVDDTSTIFHELGHAQHWFHAGFSLENVVSPHHWATSYTGEHAWREGFATFFPVHLDNWCRLCLQNILLYRQTIGSLQWVQVFMMLKYLLTTQ